MRVSFHGSGTNAEKVRRSGNWRHTAVAAKAKMEIPVDTGCLVNVVSPALDEVTCPSALNVCAQPKGTTKLLWSDPCITGPVPRTL
jgi:hypothetical protein